MHWHTKNTKILRKTKDKITNNKFLKNQNHHNKRVRIHIKIFSL